MLILHYPKCSTCRKALKWVEDHGLQAETRHEAELAEWIDRSGLPIQRFFNTSGILYRERGLKDVVKTAPREELLRLLAEDGKLVKRPLVVLPDRVLVGFKEAEWEAALL